MPVTVDEQGLKVAELARTGLSAALLTPPHQFPTGIVLAPQRRRALLDWAAAGGLVIEVDYDAEHRYDRAPVPALQACAPDHVAHAGSTSQTLAPGLRLGWLIPPRHLLADLVAAKHASDLGSPALPQLVLAHLIASGEYDRHLRLVRTRQRSRRDAVLVALREHLPQARVEGVVAGLHLLLTLPGSWSIRCPGIVSSPDRPDSSSATPLTLLSACTRPSGASLHRFRLPLTRRTHHDAISIRRRGGRSPARTVEPRQGGRRAASVAAGSSSRRHRQAPGPDVGPRAARKLSGRSDHCESTLPACLI